jgi:RHS repeat-associated protein
MWIRSYSGNDWSAHVYGLRMSYDLNGRRRELVYPHALAPRLTGSTTVYDAVQFGYDPATGFLGTVTDFLGDAFVYTYDAASRIDRLSYPTGHYKRYEYDHDGRVTLFREDLTSTSAEFRQVQTQFDARDKVVSQTLAAYNMFTETTTSGYTGLGMVASVSRPFHGATDDVSHAWDALHHLRRTYRFYVADNWEETTLTAVADNAYAVGTDRLVTSQRHRTQQDAFGGPGGNGTAPIFNEFGDSWYLYDGAGNEYWQASIDRESQRRWDEWGWHYVAGNDRHVRKASYYSAANRLVASDKRNRKTWVGGGSAWEPWYEEYRYDALGRRVLRRVRTTAPCQSVMYQGETTYLCPSLIQRFVWDGDRIVAEIQYPGDDGVSAADLERDTTSIVGESRNWGRVLYVHSSAMDHPLAVIRVGYGQPFHGQNVRWDPLVIVPHWNYEGVVHGRAYYGPTPWMYPSGAYVGFGWFGSLLADQSDANDVRYRRNRYYDPVTGRFTQEDPVHLAGGLNLYGYANGDPINVSDPFGLCPVCLVAWAVFEVASSVYDIVDLGATTIRYADGRATKTELGLTALGTGVGLYSFGGGYGRGGRVAFNRILGLRGEAIIAKLTGLTKNTSIRLGSRIPDFVDQTRGIFHAVFHESKHARRLDYTAQIREMVENLGEGQTLVVHVRKSTHVSSSFDELIASGKVKIEPSLPDLSP